MNVLWIFLFFFGISLLFGVVLSLAAKFLAVKKDERIEKIQEMLPNANCGACGFPGCPGYAEAIVKEGAPMNRCVPGGNAVYKKIAEFMGAKVEETKSEPMVAFVHCQGDDENATVKFDYQGLKDCRAKMQFFDGEKFCSYGCLGGGTCASVCPADAIHPTGHGIMKVDPSLCIGCGLCTTVCPTHVIRLIPKNAEFVVACSSKDKGGVVRKACKSGCIGCKICEKKSPEGGFSVVDNLSSIDYSQSGDREEAMKSCPAKCILKIK